MYANFQHSLLTEAILHALTVRDCQLFLNPQSRKGRSACKCIAPLCRLARNSGQVYGDCCCNRIEILVHFQAMRGKAAESHHLLTFQNRLSDV